MFKNKLLAITLTSLLSACASTTPTSTKDALSAITITNDKFNNSTTIETPLYLSRKGFTDTFPVQLKYRANYQDSKRQFIQLYITISGGDWGFYNRASGEDGSSLELVKIDNLVGSTSGIVITKEHVGLLIPMSYLSSMSAADFSIKLYGKRRSGDFVVPSSLSKAFMKKLNCFEANTCS